MSLEHYDETTSIHFKGIPSDQGSFLKAKESLDSLLRSCPCDSNCRLKVTRNSKGAFEGLLEVSFQRKIILVELKAETIEKLQENLFTQMNQKIYEWKLERSEEDITGTVKTTAFSVEKNKTIRK